MTKKRESKIEADFTKRAKLNGWKVVKFNTTSETGWPDRLCIRRGFHVYIEFKREGEVLEPHQHAKHVELERIGCNVGWFDNADDALQWLRGFV